MAVITAFLVDSLVYILTVIGQLKLSFSKCFLMVKAEQKESIRDALLVL